MSTPQERLPETQVSPITAPLSQRDVRRREAWRRYRETHRQQIRERPRRDEDEDDVRDLRDRDPTEGEHLDGEIQDREHHQHLEQLMFPCAEPHAAMV